MLDNISPKQQNIFNSEIQALSNYGTVKKIYNNYYNLKNDTDNDSDSNNFKKINSDFFTSYTNKNVNNQLDSLNKLVKMLKSKESVENDDVSIEDVEIIERRKRDTINLQQYLNQHIQKFIKLNSELLFILNNEIEKLCDINYADNYNFISINYVNGSVWIQNDENINNGYVFVGEIKWEILDRINYLKLLINNELDILDEYNIVK